MPSEESADHHLAELFESLATATRCQLWMPFQTNLSPTSPWNQTICLQHLRASLHPTPRLVVFRTAADGWVLNQAYGRAPDLRRLQLLTGVEAIHGGHGVSDQPAIRVALGEHVAAGLTSAGMFRESMISLPIGIDPRRLPDPPPLEQRSSPVVLLARHQPNLGLEVQQLLEQQGQPCHCEVTPWSHRQWQTAIASSPAALVLAGPAAMNSQRRLTAMALDTPVVANPGPPGDNLCRDGVNAIVRPPEAQALGSALLSLLDPNQTSLRRQLLEGARSTVLRHRPALQRQRWLEIATDGLAKLWRQAREEFCQAGAVVQKGEEQGL
jgi:hypothetical protein